MNEPEVFCQRCKALGGIAYRGWMILCPDCINEDQDWYEDSER